MSPKMTINRRGALRVLGALTVVPVLARLGPGGLFAMSGHHPLVPVQEGDEPWKALVFDPGQTETVATLTECIIPQTDTPGARAGKVFQHIDYVLSLESPAVRADFLLGLDWIDRKSREWFGGEFVNLAPEQQTALLTVISSENNRALSDEAGVRFFRDLKLRTIDGYYSSEAGMFEELQYEGNDFLNEYPGCQHPEHLNWEPS